MASLPISVNNNSKPVSVQSNNAGEQQGNDGFSNVLAKQMTDNSSGQPATGKLSGTGEKASPQAKDDAEKLMTTDAAAVDRSAQAQAEILASLLGQAPAGAQSADGAMIPAGQPGLAATAKPEAPKGAASLPAAGKPRAFSAQDAVPGGLSFQEVMQGMPPDAQSPVVSNALAALMKDKVAADHSPLERLQQGQPGTAMPELSTTSLQALPTSSTHATTSTAQIATPLSNPAWPDEFGQKVAWIATQQNQTAELHLNPPQLGPLDITLKLNGDQANATFVSPHAAVREAIEQALPRLREILADNGITLGQAMVSDQAPQQRRDERTQPWSSAQSTDDITENAPLLAASLPPVRRHHGMVDTFV